MITGLESLGNLQTPLNTVLENLADTIADKVIAKIKAEESNKPKYYTRKELCEILHVTNPTVIEMVKRGEIREKKIGGRILYDAAEIDEAVKEAHQQSLGGYAKSLANLKKKNLISVTPLSCALKDFIFALKLSAKALVDRLTK